MSAGKEHSDIQQFNTMFFILFLYIVP